ncbi:MAG: hypothetical protein ABSG78_05320 [Verrucomicrobiota bacterium]
MSRPRKMHKPLKGGFNEILAAVAMGSGAGKRAALKLQRNPVKPPLLTEKVGAVKPPNEKR